MDSESGSQGVSNAEIARMSADVVAAYVANNAVSVTAVPDLIRTIHGALVGLDKPNQAAAPADRQKPAVPISRSIQDDYIVCLEDGAKLKMLKRYLRSRYNLSPEEYRRKWGLPPDYPMVAPAYAARRSDFARQIGLGKGVRRRRK
ncbi:MucR family transcriptional regulator [soil metagenome]